MATVSTLKDRIRPVMKRAKPLYRLLGAGAVMMVMAACSSPVLKATELINLEEYMKINPDLIEKIRKELLV